jgi:hypothetical protein
VGPGLYVVQRFSPQKGVRHTAVLDVANRSRLVDWGPHGAKLLELSVEGLRFDSYDASHGWEVVRRIADEVGAIGRIHYTLREGSRTYDALFNNCEHLVSFVETGVRRSPQVRKFAITAGVILGVVAIASAGRKAA